MPLKVSRTAYGREEKAAAREKYRPTSLPFCTELSRGLRIQDFGVYAQQTGAEPKTTSSERKIVGRFDTSRHS
jgi:hypothetical protein